MKISSAAKMIALGIASALLLSCAPDWGYDTKFGNMPSDRPGHGNRVPSPETRKVLLLYSAGFNQRLSEHQFRRPEERLAAGQQAQ